MADQAKQAGGGLSKPKDPSILRIESFETAVMNDLMAIQKHGGGDSRASSKEFLEYMSSNSSNACGNAPKQDLDHPLSNYFISSSHNTYLTGNQLYGKATVDGYKNVLLRGCRCVEIDVWDGEPPSSSDEEERLKDTPNPSGKPTRWRANLDRVEPVVLHGYTATKDVSFRRVCETIRDNAFISSSLPVIVSLEVHAGHDQQEIMVEIMNDCFQGLLVDVESASDVTLPFPSALQNKILIKVKYSPSQSPEEAHQITTNKLSKVSSPASFSSGEEDVISARDGVKRKPSKIIDGLSQLGVYTRSCKFKSLTQPEAKIPTHVFSLSEGALMEVHKLNPAGLFDHNKHYLMRAYPKGTRISSSNLDPTMFWRQGVQMVALNWQKFDAGVMLNEGMFADSGGWVLKPKTFRTSDHYLGDDSTHGSRFVIQLLSAQNIDPPKETDADEFNPFIKIELHLKCPGNWEDGGAAKEKDNEFKAKTKTAKGRHPNFKGQTIDFGELPSIEPSLGFLRIKVMHDKKFKKDPLAGWACIRLDRLQRGFRFIHLFDAKGVQTKGVVLVHLDYNWKTPSIRAAGSQMNILPLR